MIQRIKDVDDLEIIPCDPCRATGKQGKNVCPICKGTKDRVIRRQRMIEITYLTKRELREKKARRHG